MAVNFSQVEDQGASELTVEIDGCSVPKVPVDGGSGVNLMLEDTAFDLGYTSFETTDQVLRMADQSRVVSVGRLSQVPTLIGEVTYLLNYVIIWVSAGRPFPMLLGRPWLYAAEVVVDWGAKEFSFGKPKIRIPWKTEEHLGETSESDGYTTDWSDPEDSSTSFSYFVEQFAKVSETDFSFPLPTTDWIRPEEAGHPDEDIDRKPIQLEDRSLGEANVPFSSEWIQQQMKEAELPPIGLSEHSEHQWNEIRVQPEEQDPERIKNVVDPSAYEKVEVSPGKVFYLGRMMKRAEKEDYMGLLKEYADVFVWTPSDLRGIPPKLGEHHIDLIDGSVPVRQRQYRLNPKYSLMVKEEIDRLLEAGFIYPVNNSEWVSPIVVVPKKVGADGKVKIRIC